MSDDVNKEKLDHLLSLCTERQLTLFNRIYPNGPTNSQIQHATDLCSRTLKEDNQKIENLNNTITELKEKLETTTTTKHNAIVQAKQLERELEILQAKIDRTPLSQKEINSNDVQDKLELLAALEAGGVDNWEGYDYSRENANLI